MHDTHMNNNFSRYGNFLAFWGIILMIGSFWYLAKHPEPDPWGPTVMVVGMFGALYIFLSFFCVKK